MTDEILHRVVGVDNSNNIPTFTWQIHFCLEFVLCFYKKGNKILKYAYKILKYPYHYEIMADEILHRVVGVDNSNNIPTFTWQLEGDLMETYLYKLVQHWEDR